MIAVFCRAVHLVRVVTVPVLEECQAPRMESVGGAAAARCVQGPVSQRGLALELVKDLRGVVVVAENRVESGLPVERLVGHLYPVEQRDHLAARGLECEAQLGRDYRVRDVDVDVQIRDSYVLGDGDGVLEGRA